ncbi:FecR domain-containing protein [Acidovorax sp. sic0104]|uniref:FecR domain-containing protein n=1 Tax=Acidovorax sp. sic0104 TaxID=2854784 RepID=UPI001C4527AF|nr:FecR domain-containing protein [Acidovorax sp. sic0104]
MKPPAPALRASVASLEQAAQWYATLRDDRATESDQLAWRTWLAQSPEHEAAWAHIDTVSRKFDPLRGLGPPGTAAAVAGLDVARAKAVGRRSALNALGGGLGLGVVAWLGWRHTPLPALAMARLRADHHTGTGERRDLALADGSRVWLNTRTALQVRLNARERRLVLLAGEILVDTARDALQRPFYVDTAHGRLQALGTRFTVRDTEGRVRLNVFEGLVEIHTHGGKVLRVPAGQAAGFDAETVSALQDADRLREAWSRGSLPADSLPLGSLLEELGRYRHGHISVAPEVAGLQVMGVYPADDPEQALYMLEQALPIRVRRALPWWTTVEAR